MMKMIYLFLEAHKTLICSRNKENHWLEVSATKLLGYYSDTTRLNLDNIKMQNVNYC